MSAAPPQAATKTEDKIGRDDRSALICCHESTYSQYLESQLRGMGYKVHHADGHSAATQRVAARTYHLTMLLENLEGCVLGQNKLLAHLASLPTDERRATFVVMFCQSYGTGDEMAAYAHSVDLLINYQDIRQFTALTTPALEEHDESSHQFRAVAARLAA